MHLAEGYSLSNLKAVSKQPVVYRSFLFFTFYFLFIYLFIYYFYSDDFQNMLLKFWPPECGTFCVCVWGRGGQCCFTAAAAAAAVPATTCVLII
jgi:hypothetical protein